MDDPFDQLHGPNAGNLNDIIPNVDLIDNDTDGGDNRPVGQTDPAVGIYGPFTTDECGQVTLRLEVSMQPGNNYRAAASLIEEAMTQDTIYIDQPVTPQEHADALSAWWWTASGRWDQNGNYNGYSCPRTWSPMLTVWRKLHVEFDSMGAEPTSYVGREPDWQSVYVNGATAGATTSTLQLV